MASRMVELAVHNAAAQKRAELEWLKECEKARKEIAKAGKSHDRS